MVKKALLLLACLLASAVLFACDLAPEPEPTTTASPKPQPTATTVPVAFGDQLVVFQSLKENSEWDDHDIYVASVDSGGLVRLTDTPSYDGSPAWLPDGQHIAFLSNRDGRYPGLKEIYILDVQDALRNPAGSKAVRLTDDLRPSSPVWSPDGQHIAYISFWGAELHVLAVPDETDADHATPVKRSSDLIHRLTTDKRFSDSGPAWSPDGRHIAFYSLRRGSLGIFVLNVQDALKDADGAKATRLARNLVERIGKPVWSPDSRYIAFVAYRDDNMDIYVTDVEKALRGEGNYESRTIRLTNDPAYDSDPNWSPDGTRIAFCSNREGNSDIYVVNVQNVLQSSVVADGAVTRLTNYPGDDYSPCWSPDGRRIAFIAFSSTTCIGDEILYVMNADGTGRRPLLTHPSPPRDYQCLSWSPK